ncbi:ceramidase [Tuwongella immobilis]|uniref:Hemolysin III n=1 Tax=Tuwongella immobilis TaxID=692036 RepID=A0A6C2YR84_9BACT|nr:ceramidase [Tuwongella immobilis]VIP03669.1 Uncharacterized protein OS=Solitalea canadensis (strain ATCC 29591 / DSM 3403 / NBRC 15130 / NCIMB 12057 / USAM 9D) GN=Solca_4237 PE=4 SV=1 [Tuwongella immobilis]VTS04706.1 Uncharacterized protein OS=Solitalea canadensis (strain ATCC 29591 / DSM 3403 / NBRC 15130 / NCIMB 12057 / USAM 9D) GN=Solca_4237 PE=4 SV=1 [Tuwongella immobilis]
MDPLNQRLDRDGGPIYVETVDLSAPIVEPWNATSAALFVLIAVYWLIRLRGRYRSAPFVTICLPILLVGGIGGTLYHATRASRVYFLMDVIPIGILASLAGLYLWIRMTRMAILPLFGLAIMMLLVQTVGFRLLPAHWAINVSYGMLAASVILPAGILLVQTRFFAGGWFITAMICFGVAFLFRMLDVLRPPVLPMGTHWLWHTFGAACTASLCEYFYRLSTMPASAASAPPSPSDSPSASGASDGTLTPV